MKKTIFFITIIGLSIASLKIINAGPVQLKKNLHEIKLSNGMRWLLVEKHQAPVFSGVVIVRVGGIDEQKGKTGLAHFFEHMAFKGSHEVGTKNFVKEEPLLEQIKIAGKNLTNAKCSTNKNKSEIKKLEKKLIKLEEQAKALRIDNELWEIMTRNGAADLNAFTSKDQTTYYASMPANKLELWMKMISEMTSDPLFREFYIEKNVILEERRDGLENNPNGKTIEVLLMNAFDEAPYSWSVFGSIGDLECLTIDDAVDFHKEHYVGSNMVGALVGDFDAKKLKPVLEKYFGAIPQGKVSKDRKNIINKGAGQVKFEFNAEPAIIRAYHKPTLPDNAEFAFDVIEVLLCHGATSRLQKRLVFDEKLANSVYCSDSFPGARLDNLFIIWVEPNSSHTPDEISKVIDQEIEKLKTEKVKISDLNKVRRKVEASFVFALDDNMILAQKLAEFEVLFDNWELLLEYPSKLNKITSTDIKRVANKYFTNKGKTEVIRLKK